MAKRDAADGQATTESRPAADHSAAAERAAAEHTGVGANGASENGASENGAALGWSDPLGPSSAVGRDYGALLIVIGVVLAAVLTVVLIGLPGSRTAPAAAPIPDNEFTRIIGSVQTLLAPSDHSLPVVLGKLVLAALLGGVIGYRQRIHVEEYIVQAHVIIAFTGALMMIIIGNEIVRAFGLVGAGSIIRYRTPVRDPRALASLFVTMGVGIAVGTGLFELALIGGVLIVLLQGLMGSMAGALPTTLYNPQRSYTLTLQSEDGGGTIVRLKELFSIHDIRYRLKEYDARAGKKDGLVKIVMDIEAAANLTTEQLTLLVFQDGVQSVSWEEETA